MSWSIYGRGRAVALACALILAPLQAAAAASLHNTSAPAVAGTIGGVVRDSTGGALPNVTLTIAALRRVTTTDAQGQFIFRAIPPGRYHIDAALIGFARAEAAVEVTASSEEVNVTILMRATPLRLSNVVITATPGGGDPLGITQSTVDLGGKELARSLGSSLAATLEAEPGMATRYNGPAATMPIIRGLTGERILVLQDGERSADLSSAASDHGTTIDPLTADRIEVVRGPASLLYGSSALGGVVNVISNLIPSGVPSHIDGFIGGQSESSTPGGALAGGLTVPVRSRAAFTASGGLRNTQSVRMGGGQDLFNSDARNMYANSGLSTFGSRGSLGVSLGRYDFRYGLPSQADDPEAGGKIDGVRSDGRVRAELNRNGRLPLLTLAASASRYEHSEIENTGEIATSFNLETQTANLTSKTAVGIAVGAVGVSALFRQYGAVGEEALTPAADSRALGVFLYQDIPLGQAEGDQTPRLQLGGRYDRLQIDSKVGDEKFGPAQGRNFKAFSGSLGVTFPLTQTTSLALSGARAFRAPSVEELFSNAFHAAARTYDVGNPDLASETNTGVEAVYRVQNRRIDAQVATYYSTIRNYIVPSIEADTTIDSGETVPLNRFSQGHATLKGVEGRVEGTIARHFVVGAMTDLTRASFRTGGNIPFMPAPRLGAHARWDNGTYRAGGEFRHGGKQNRVTGGEIDVATNDYSLFSLHAGWTRITAGMVHSITLRADNVTDVPYRDATSRIKSFAYNPGRNFAAVYKVLF